MAVEEPLLARYISLPMIRKYHNHPSATTTGETVQTNTPLGTVTFSRKVKVRDYETAEAAVFLQFEVPALDSADNFGEVIISRISDAFMQAKTAVFDELGIEFSVDEGGVVREVLRNTFGPVTEVTAPAAQPRQVVAASRPAPQPAAAPAAPAASADGPPHDPATTDKAQQKANKAWAKARLATNPDEFWDNRDKKASGQYKPGAADFKHKDTGISVWVDG